MARITVRTAEKSNTNMGGTEDKFYRTYELPHASVFQWGSQRNGRSGGQFKTSPGPTDAATVMSKKMNDGYVLTDVDTFDLPDTDVNTVMGIGDAKQLGARMESHYNVAVRNGNVTKSLSASNPTSLSPTPGQKIPDGQHRAAAVKQTSSTDTDDAEWVVAGLNGLASQALDLMGVAATDPIAAIQKRRVLLENAEKVTKVVGKLNSYLETLDELIGENA